MPSSGVSREGTHVIIYAVKFVSTWALLVRGY